MPINDFQFFDKRAEPTRLFELSSQSQSTISIPELGVTSSRVEPGASTKLISSGFIPVFGLSINQHRALETPLHALASRTAADILPSLQLNRLQSNSTDADNPRLSAADRRYSIFYKIEIGEIDPTELFKNPAALFDLKHIPERNHGRTSPDSTSERVERGIGGWPADGPRIIVENRGATPEFQERMQREVDRLPAGVRRLLAANGTRIVVGDKVSGVYPELRGVRPRGWPEGTTWDNADGLYSPGDRTTVVTENRNQGGETVPNDRSEGVLHHELGHAIDHAMGNFSHSEEFRAAYERDCAALSPADRERLAYLLQGGDSGKEECFAEVIGALLGSCANGAQTQEILRKFPSLAALLRAKLEAL